MSKRVRIVLIVFVVMIAFLAISYYEDHKYDYEMNKEKNKYLEKITYEVPNSFKKSSYNYSDYYYNNKYYSRCNFEIKYFENYYNYVSGDEYLKDRIYFTLRDEISDIKEVSINNYKWYLVIKSSDSGKNYYYATIYNGVGYYMEYEICDYKHGDYEKEDNFCEINYDKIISSVKFK